MKEEHKRTIQQNRALHKYFRLLAEEFNAAGLDMRLVLKPEIAISWTARNVKDYLWRPFQRALTNKESTKELGKLKEIDLIYDNLNRHLSEKFGLHVPFPTSEVNFLDEYERLPKQK